MVTLGSLVTQATTQPAALPPLTALLLAYLLFSILLSFQIKKQAVLIFPLFITDVSTSVGEFGVS